MKALIIGLICIFSGSILLAQIPADSNRVATDSMNNNMNKDSSQMNNNSMTPTDTTNSQLNADTTNRNLNPAANNNMATMDSSAYSNNSLNTNTPGHVGYLNLPLLMTYVPDDVVSKLKSQFSGQLYSITSIKGSAAEDNYVVRTPNNGVMQIQTVDGNGTVISTQ